MGAENARGVIKPIPAPPPPLYSAATVFSVKKDRRGAAEALLDDICGFLEDRPGRAAPTGLIVDAFSHRVKDKGMFRKLLKQAARLEKGAGTAQWVLRDEFA